MSDAIVFDVVWEALAQRKPVGPGDLPRAGRATDTGEMRDGRRRGLSAERVRQREHTVRID